MIGTDWLQPFRLARFGPSLGALGLAFGRRARNELVDQALLPSAQLRGETRHHHDDLVGP